MLAHILGPALRVVFESGSVTGVQGARRLLITGQITGKNGHEAVSSPLGSTHAFGAGVLLPRLVHKSAQDGRGATLLRFEPFPVPGQQRHLAGDDAKFRPSPSRRFCFRLSASEHVLEVATQIEIDALTRSIFKNKELGVGVGRHRLHTGKDVRKCARNEPA